MQFLKRKKLQVLYKMLLKGIKEKVNWGIPQWEGFKAIKYDSDITLQSSGGEHLWTVTVFGVRQSAVGMWSHFSYMDHSGLVFFTEQTTLPQWALSTQSLPVFSNLRMWLGFTSFSPMSPRLGWTFVEDICQHLREILGLSPRLSPSWSCPGPQQ